MVRRLIALLRIAGFSTLLFGILGDQTAGQKPLVTVPGVFHDVSDGNELAGGLEGAVPLPTERAPELSTTGGDHGCESGRGGDPARHFRWNDAAGNLVTHEDLPLQKAKGQKPLGNCEDLPAAWRRPTKRADGEAEAGETKPAVARFHWKPALAQSGLFLAVKHGTRLFQSKTRREFEGPFFRDWGRSVRSLRGWNDGDSPLVNNIAHPLQGAVTGWIFINNSDRSGAAEFGKSKVYWISRLKALAWSTAWSTQFEMGPISEATIGNVGLREKNGHSTIAWTDLVLTPSVGTGILVGEGAIDKYILKRRFERGGTKRLTVKVKLLRSFLTPTMSFSNLLRARAPWKRTDR